MKEVYVNKAELLPILKGNLATHQKVFEEALEGYRKRAIATFEEALANARAGKRIRQYIQLQQPVNQSAEYERTIRMLEMSVEDNIKLTSGEFECYVMDRWPWRQNFLAINKMYSATAMAMDSDSEDEDDAPLFTSGSNNG